MNEGNPLPTAENDQPQITYLRTKTVRKSIDLLSPVAPEEHQKVVTEGQLKWAQFHYKRRAQCVKQKVEELWQTPASPSDVEGALSDDGNTTEGGSSVAEDYYEDDKAAIRMLRQKPETSKRNKPTISRGRRAMLRVSKRTLAKRQEEIKEYGFRCGDGYIEEDNNNEDDEALAAKFADETAWKKARRNRLKSRRCKANSTQESLRRFENAFRAMMRSLAASQPQNPEIAAPTKVWSRPEDAPAFVSIDGRQYRDLKWGVSASKEKVAQRLTTTDFASMPIDPRASWLVHIPFKARGKAMGPYTAENANGELLVPENINGSGEKMIPNPLGSKKFNEIVGIHQPQAKMSQQLEEQLELMQKRSNTFKWQIADHVQAPFQQDDDGREEDEEFEDDAYDEDEALDPENLKAIAAQCLAEFVANADEEHLFALREQCLDDIDVETLAKASSDDQTIGLYATSASKYFVPKYLQEVEPPKSSNKDEYQSSEENGDGRDNAHRSQMASFAGISARYLDEVSRPGKMERRVLKELKSVLKQLHTNGTLSDCDKSAGSLDESNRHKIEKALLRSHKKTSFPTDARQEERAKLSKLVSDYLGTLCESLPTAVDRNDTICKYLESLNGELHARPATLFLSPIGKKNAKTNETFASSAAPVAQAERPYCMPSDPAGPIRNPKSPEGVAAKYLSAVVDAQDYDDDIFAELRKRDRPKYLENTLASGHHALWHAHIDNVQMKTDHNLETSDLLSSLSQSLGLSAPQDVDTDISLDQKTAIGYLSKLRPDHEEEVIRKAVGNLGDTDQARAHFSRGVTQLLMGVKNGADPKRSQAPTCRDVALMRGTTVVHFESVRVDEAAFILFECSCQGDPRMISLALRKIGKDDGERFAEFISGYLKGTNSPANGDGSIYDGPESIYDGLDVPEQVESRSPDLPAANFPQSDSFAGTRQKHTSRPAKKLSYETACDSVQPVGNETTGEENVVKNTFNSTVGDTENIPFDPVPSVFSQDPTSTHSCFDHDINRSYASPSRSDVSYSEFSPDRLRDFHQSVMEKSALIGEGNTKQTIIDTDGTTSEASDTVMCPRRLAGLLLSPTILTKRHRQAVECIEKRKWDQVSYLLSANPWLAEMPEISTNQYLLHKIAYYGGGDIQHPSAPEELCTELVRMYPAVQKFDHSGCVPLHSASEAGNVRMIMLLGDCFPSGASVRNEDGMLPIHLAIASLGSRKDKRSSLLEVVQSLLGFFPGALAVSDNAGNLPLHIAVNCLDGKESIDAINLLLDEADKQLKLPDGVRFHNKPKVEDTENGCGTTTTARTEVPSEDDVFDDELPSSMIANDAGDIPLWIALRRRAALGIIEALAMGPGGRQSALKQDAQGNTALHIALVQDRIQMSALKMILNVAPECALKTNIERLLPVEVACLKNLSPDVVLELLLVDLPVALSDKACLKPSGRGASLWFLVCQCNDRYVGVLETLISMCSYQQVHALALMTRDDSRATLISRATPQCGELLTVSLLFVGRFEFLAFSPQDISGDVKTFDALDYGRADYSYEGRRVNLRCFTAEEQYKEEISTLRSLELDFDYVEQVSCFVVGERDSYDSGGRQQFCVAVEQPSLTLDRVVAGMLKNDVCRKNTGLRRKYVNKVISVLRVVAKALHRLHSFGVVHGNLIPENCGKCGDRWKLLGTLRFQKIGAKFDPHVIGESVPPEALELQSSAAAIDRQATFRTSMAVDPAIDVWSFGKLSYDVLVGQSLVAFDTTGELHQDHRSLLKILHWSNLDLVDVRRRLGRVGVPDSTVYLITKCLSPDPGSRPSMSEVLRSGPWEDMHCPSVQITQATANLHEC